MPKPSIVLFGGAVGLSILVTFASAWGQSSGSGQKLLQVLEQSPLLKALADKQRECYLKAVKGGLKDDELFDSMEICALEARLDCLKKASVKKLKDVERRDFLVVCMKS